VGGRARQDGGQLGVNEVAAADVFRFWGAEGAVGGFAQQRQLLRIEFAEFARFLIENQRAIANAADFLDEVTDFFEHFAQLAVSSLNENDFVPGIVALTDLTDAGRGCADLG
jgi:hypothetical protein